LIAIISPLLPKIRLGAFLQGELRPLDGRSYAKSHSESFTRVSALTRNSDIKLNGRVLLRGAPLQLRIWAPGGARTF
jgi:hypothetical protein